jgi:hypothetical protein
VRPTGRADDGHEHLSERRGNPDHIHDPHGHPDDDHRNDPPSHDDDTAEHGHWWRYAGAA